MDRLSYNLVDLPGFGRVVTTGRRSLVNPGNRKTPTYYYSYSVSTHVGRGTTENRDYAGGKWTVTSSPSYCAHLGQGVVSAPLPSDFTVSPPGGSDYAECVRRATSKLLSKVLDAKRSDFNAGVFAAEAGKSAEMIVNAATRVYAAQRALKRGDLGDMYKALGIDSKSARGPKRAGERRYPKGKDVRDNMSNYWLEASYGWKPLLSDAKSAAEKLASVVLDEPTALTVRGRASIKRPAVLASGLDGTAKWNSYDLERVKVEIGVKYQVSSRAILMASSLGLTNPMLMAWELFPLSFVWDWFIPIGDFLEELTAFHGFSFLSGYQSEVLEREYFLAREGNTTIYSEGWLPGGVWGPNSLRIRSAASYRSKKSGFVRRVLSGFPTAYAPRPRVTEWPLSARKMVTAVALIRQRV